MTATLFQHYLTSHTGSLLTQSGGRFLPENLHILIHHYHHVFQAKGIQKNDRVFLAHTYPDSLLPLILSLWSLGAIPCFIQSGCPQKNRHHAVEHIQPHWVITRKHTIFLKYHPQLWSLKTLSEPSIRSPTINPNPFDIAQSKPHETALILYHYTESDNSPITAYSHTNLLRHCTEIANHLPNINTMSYYSDHIFFTLAAFFKGQDTYTDLHESSGHKINKMIERHGIKHLAVNPYHLYNYRLKNLKHDNITHVSIGPDILHTRSLRPYNPQYAGHLAHLTITTFYGVPQCFPISVSPHPLKTSPKGFYAGFICKDLNPIHTGPVLRFSPHHFATSITRDPVMLDTTGFINHDQTLVLTGHRDNHTLFELNNSISLLPMIQDFYVFYTKGKLCILYTTPLNLPLEKDIYPLWKKIAQKHHISLLYHVKAIPKNPLDNRLVCLKKVKSLIARTQPMLLL